MVYKNISDDEAALLQGLFIEITGYDTDELISAGEWLWCFLEDYRFASELARGTSHMDILRNLLKSSDYDLDVDDLIKQGRDHYARHHFTIPTVPEERDRQAGANSNAHPAARTPPAALGDRNNRQGGLVDRWSRRQRRSS